MGNSEGKEAQQEFRSQLLDGDHTLEQLEASWENVKKLNAKTVTDIISWREFKDICPDKEPDTRNVLQLALSPSSHPNFSKFDGLDKRRQNKLDFFLKYYKEFASRDKNLLNDQKNVTQSSILHLLIEFLAPIQSKRDIKKSYRIVNIIEELCLDGANVNLVDAYSHTPLMLLCDLKSTKHHTKSKHYADICEVLLANGANESINHRDRNGYNAIMLAARRKFHVAVKELAPLSDFSKVPDGPKDYNWNDPLLVAIHAGADLEIVSAILARSPPDVRKTDYYRRDDSPGFNTPLRLASYHKEIFDFLLQNNFDLSDWKTIFNRGAAAKRYMFRAKKRYLTNRNGFSKYKGLLNDCAGTSALAQAALLENYELFKYLIDFFDPRVPCKNLPNQCSVLHVIASFAPRGSVDGIDHGVEFVDLIRDKCTKYSESGKYDWYVHDSEGKTPLDYCIEANEEDFKKDKQHPPPTLPADVQVLTISRTYTALVFIETLKHNNKNQKFALQLQDPTSETMDILFMAPPPLAESVVSIFIRDSGLPGKSFQNLQTFTKLETLTLVKCSNAGLSYIFGSPETNELHANLQTLTAVKCSNINADSAKEFSRDGLKIEIHK